MSFCRLTYHVVFGTKNRHRTITMEHEKELYALLLKLIQNHGGYVHRIGGVADHVHILFDLPPTESVSKLVQVLKQTSSLMMNQNPKFPHWNGWADGYAAFSYSKSEIPTIIAYIKNQRAHHLRVSFRDEYRAWLIEQGVSPDAPYFPQ